MKKKCNGCNQIHAATAFSVDRAAPDGLNRRCRVCLNTRSRELAKAPHRKAAKRKWAHRGSWPALLLKTHGLTIEAYAWMLYDQGFACAVCDRDFPNDIVYGRTAKFGPCVDHNHSTGEIRGLLCGECNYRLLGEMERDPSRTKRALEYLGWHVVAPSPLRKMA